MKARLDIRVHFTWKVNKVENANCFSASLRHVHRLKLECFGGSSTALLLLDWLNYLGDRVLTAYDLAESST